MAARRKRGETLPVAMAEEEWELAVSAEASDSTAVVAGFGGSAYISTKGGKFTYNGEILETPIEVIVLDEVRENNYFSGVYDAENPAAPDCFALARNEHELAPPEDLKTKQNDQCTGCWANQFGTADVGRGKACKNTVRLALLPAGELTPAGLGRSEPALLRLPVTSVKGFAQHLRSVAGGLGKQLFAVTTKIDIHPDEKNQHMVTFELGKAVPASVGRIVLQKRGEITDDLERLPDPNEETPKAAPRGRKKVAAKKAGRKKAARRRG